jgi:hypothetical protein
MQSGQQPRDPESLVVEKEVINVFDHGMAVPCHSICSRPLFSEVFVARDFCPLPVLLRFAPEPGFPPPQRPRKLRGLRRSLQGTATP